jgi:hypothetical protein
MNTPRLLRLTPVVLFLIAIIFIGYHGTALAQLQKTVALLKGDVLAQDGSPLSGASVSVYKGTDKVLTTHTNDQGKFTAIVQPGTSYKIAITHPTSLYLEDAVVIPASEKYLEFPYHASLKPLLDGMAYDIPTPVFMPGNSEIEAGAKTALDGLVTTLKHNPKISIICNVYPDAPIKGGKKDAKSDAKQQSLLVSRATSLAAYFSSAGIQEAAYSINTAKTVPAGRFPQTVVVTKGKKGKPKSTTVLVPQYAEIITHLS